GAMILLASWLFTNTLIKTLAGDSDLSNNWYNIECKVGTLKEITQPGPSVPKPGTSITPNPKPGQCLFTGTNLCEASTTTPYSKSTIACGFSSCNQYLPAINQYASKWGVSADLVKAVMVKESNCKVNASSGVAFGLMQFKPSTANLYRQYCNISQPVDAAWLTNPSNASLSICLGAKFLSALSEGTCGPKVQNIAAGYNAGPGNCKESTDCKGQKSCTDGGPTRKWECLYDNPQNTVCNSRLNQAKDYEIKVNYCYKNPGF
ncbi:transglycosylase SLT domain-containing protein, partial [Candidatus Parcubacteria bacterium]|nr:transglycosylase SLT domain-containing protein [Candidatus Parcubacteria bacterium]